MGKQPPPDWAIERALTEIKTFGQPVCHVVKAFARYIAEHEEPPVDPIVAAGRKLVAETQHNFPDSPWHVHEAEETLAGNRDYKLVVKAAVEGVRRGIEIGKGEK